MHWNNSNVALFTISNVATHTARTKLHHRDLELLLNFFVTGEFSSGEFSYSYVVGLSSNFNSTATMGERPRGLPFAILLDVLRERTIG